MIGPDLRSFDLALMRTFPLHRWKESAGLQFRVETFNLFNHANFGPPQLTVFAGQADNEAPLSSFGQVRATVTAARQIQLGLRLNF
jgi:hypothetical protein